VLADDHKACAYGFRGARYFQEALATYFFSRDRIIPPLDVSRDPLTPDDLAKAMAERNGPGSNVAAIVGDPAAAIETVSRFHVAGVDELILVMDLGTVPHEIVTESIRTFAQKVMDRFK
jgi:alkanesulfonate monooxygenase SsuD/methylene tetrahydromethanopterin reductase-like flavin-dependent oxidoreductase (luciferase family)